MLRSKNSVRNSKLTRNNWHNSKNWNRNNNKKSGQNILRLDAPRKKSKRESRMRRKNNTSRNIRPNKRRARDSRKSSRWKLNRVRRLLMTGLMRRSNWKLSRGRRWSWEEKGIKRRPLTPSSTTQKRSCQMLNKPIRNRRLWLRSRYCLLQVELE